MRIPAIDAPAMLSRSTADAEVAAARDRALAGARVLVVEDDADAREFIARLLREWGAMVRTAGSVSEALDEKGDFFTTDRLRELLAKTAKADLAQTVYEAVKAFAGGAPQSDDITVMAVRYTAKRA